MKKSLTTEQILNASSHAVIATDENGRIVFANPQVEHFFGFKRGAILGADVTGIPVNFGLLVAAALESGQPNLGCSVRGKHGDMLLNLTLIRQDGQVKGAVCSFQKMEQLESSARELESYKTLSRQLHAIFQSSSDGIWVCDGQGKVISINRASEELNGIKAEDVIGRNVADIVADGWFDRSVTLEVLETGRQASIIQHVTRTNRILLATGTPVIDEAGAISMVVVNERDMTQLNAIREQLEQSRLVTEKYQEELAELSLLELKKQEFVAENSRMQQVLKVALKLAHLEASNILILGESGTGKGLLAKFIHKNGRRKNKPFIEINCAALPENLLEAELFGYEKGAFTGAREQGKVGLFELAHGGTLFLDEIGDLPFSVQAKLLKYLDDQEIMRLGGLKPRKIDCTIVAATNRDLEALTHRNQFRQDLFFRLNTFTIRIPPLRERPEDIFELADHFLREYNRTYRLKRRLAPGALKSLQSHSFPGNVRELKNLLKQAVLFCETEMIDDLLIGGAGKGAALPGGRAGEASRPKSLTGEIDALEKQILENALLSCKTTRELARQLGISQPTVVRKLRKHGLSRRLMH